MYNPAKVAQMFINLVIWGDFVVLLIVVSLSTKYINVERLIDVLLST